MKFSTAANEALASVVVFLVALPLCMGIAIASGLPPAAGLISGIIGGLVVGTLAGSPLQVSGPAAGLVVLVFDIVQTYGVASLSAIIVLAGLIQVIAGRLRIGRWFRAVAPEVLQAMLAGIGILIVASQLHVMIDDTPSASGLANLLALPAALSKAISPAAGMAHQSAALIGLLTLGLLIAWNVVRSRLPKQLQLIPAPLVAVASATAVAAGLDLMILRVTVPDQLAAIIQPPGLSAFEVLLQPAVLGTAFAVAFVASAESLISAAAVDKLHNGPRSDLDRELTAQGIGNIVLGFLGGLPVTGVIVRSSANVAAGAKTRWSAVLHGLWLLIAVAVLPFVLELIPVASLAAVLVYVGYKLVDRAAIRAIWRRSPSELAVYVITVGCIVGMSLLEGLFIGSLLAVMQLAWRVSHVDVEVEERDDGVVYVTLQGAATFLSLPRLTHLLDDVDPTATVRLCLQQVKYLDASVVELIGTWQAQRDSGGGCLIFADDEIAHHGQAPRKLRQAA